MDVNCNKNAMLCAIAKPHPIKTLVTVCGGKEENMLPYFKCDLKEQKTKNLSSE